MFNFFDTRPALLLQQSGQYIEPTSFPASWAILVENTWLGSMEIELALQTLANRIFFKKSRCNIFQVNYYPVTQVASVVADQLILHPLWLVVLSSML